jgi:4-amino-4-deoxy-L-arabinose transferase-like glycosyltransferase
VLAWLAASWKVFGYSPMVTRCAMLTLAAFSLLGFFKLAMAVSNVTVATVSTFLTAIYPVFFAQSSLAMVDLPAAGLVFWGLYTYVREQRARAGLWFGMAALAKETAILVPIALFGWELVGPRLRRTRPFCARRSFGERLPLLVPVLPLLAWYGFHFFRTGFVFGNPEFFRYNVQGTLHPLRIFLALLLRIWQAFGYLNLYLLTLASIMAMWQPPLEDHGVPRPRIEVSIQLSFLAITTFYLLAMAVIGGAVLARYMLPVVPLAGLICVSTIWRRLRMWKTVLAIVAAGFVAALFVNPPYGFSPEDNLAYNDFIRLHQHAARIVQTKYPNATVMTAWPGSDELAHPYLGYVAKPTRVVRIEDFSLDPLLAAAGARARYDIAFVFSTKYRPATALDRWKLWQEWKTEYFGFHRDLPPEEAALVLGGRLVFREELKGQWVGIIEIESIERASAASHRQQMAGVRLYDQPHLLAGAEMKGIARQ